MSDNLFSGEGETLPSVDPNKDYLQELVGEGRKFKTPQDLARGKFEADAMIEVMKRSQDELRTEYLRVIEENKAKAGLEAYLDKIQAQQPTSNNTQSVNVDSPKPIDPKEIENLFDRKIQEHDVRRKEQENFSEVQKKLKERHGSNYSNALKQQIADLGITEEFANNLARNNPAVFYRTFGLDQPVATEGFLAPPRNDRRFDSSVKTNTSGARPWSYYKELRDKNPTAFFDRNTNIQMQKDYITLGKSFEDGDFLAHSQSSAF